MPALRVPLELESGAVPVSAVDPLLDASLHIVTAKVLVEEANIGRVKSGMGMPVSDDGAVLATAAVKPRVENGAASV